MRVDTPTYDQDFWSDEALLDPYPVYERLRSLGAAVWLAQHDTWAITRYAQVKAALLDSETFSSSHGCSMNEAVNSATGNRVMLCVDGPQHRDMRGVFIRPLVPAALATLKARITELAESRVAAVVAQGRFDAVADLAHYLPLNVVAHLVGLNEEGKEHMLEWAGGMFNSMGPEGNQRTLQGLEISGQVFDYIANRAHRSTLDPGGWGAALFTAADKGEISAESATAMLMDYIGPALDTTINATSSAIWLFAQHPDQWERIRNDASLIPKAINETLRLESPIRAFTRYLTRDVEIEGQTLRQGSRVLMLYACANRDERHYANADQFDVSRRAMDHLAFGHGSHMCAGMHLARLEIASVLEALRRRVAKFQVDRELRIPHNTLRGLSRLDVSVIAA